MGNMSEYRGILVVFTFVCVALFLIGLAVSESPGLFTGTSTDGTSPSNGGNLQSPNSFFAWNTTTLMNISDADPSDECSLGSIQFKVFDRYDGSAVKSIQMETWSSFYGYPYDELDFSWYNVTTYLEVSVRHDVYFSYPPTFMVSHITLNLSDVDAAYASGNLSSLIYQVRNTKTKLTVNIAFNFTDYASPSEALTGDGLSFRVVQDFNDRDTSINILGFISGLFLFSLPGAPVAVSAIISFALIGAMSYIAFIVVLRILGAIFGGGGA